MKEQIRTKAHIVEGLLTSGQLYFQNVKKGEAVPFFQVPNFDLAPLFKLIASTRQMPKFYIHSNLVELTLARESCIQSINAMKEADVLHLPYPAMVMESDYEGKHVFVILSEVNDENGQFLGVQFHVNKDTDGDFLVAPCFAAYFNWDNGNIETKSFSTAWVTEEYAISTRGDKHETTKASVGNASALLFVALVLMNAAGVARQVVEPTGLNAARRKRGVPEIPKHTVIHIDRVYGRNGTATSYEASGRRMPIHLRRAHNRRVRYGKGLTETRLRHIPAVLVNFKEGEAPPEYTVKE